MKKLGIALGCMALVGGMLFANGSSEKSSPDVKKINNTNSKYELVIGHIVDESHTWNKASLYFKEQIEKQSNGRITVKVYPNSQLGSEVEMIQSALTGGGCDMGFTGESMQTYNKDLGIIGMPYAITSDEQMDRVLNGSVGDLLKKDMLDSGLHVLATIKRGARNITSNKLINSPDDLKGFIIRTPQSPMTVAAFKAMGAKPTPMAFNEVFTSLQSGVIDGQENPLAMIKSGGFAEVQKYCNVTEHLRAWVYFYISEVKFESLPSDLQSLVLKVGADTQVYEHKLFINQQDKLKSDLEASGMIFNTVDQEPFAEKAVKGVLPILTDSQRALYEKMVAEK
ncbi:MAG: TRAP transporter substrate-binding protein [Peptostreptococcaceae bacterium]|nr:TRAP transporter substrate-binding protein [Peptostreptococcaceae bacterium]